MNPTQTLAEKIAAGPYAADWTPARLAAEIARRQELATVEERRDELRYKLIPHAVIAHGEEGAELQCPYCGSTDLQVEYDCLDMRSIEKVRLATEVHEQPTIVVVGFETSDSDSAEQLWCRSCYEYSVFPPDVDVDYL